MSQNSVTIQLSEPQLAVLDRYRHDHQPALTRDQMVANIVSSWLSEVQVDRDALADEGLRPEQLNASNDI